LEYPLEFFGEKLYSTDSPAELFAYGLGYTPMLKMDPNVVVAVDGSGNQFKIVTLPKEKLVKRHRFSPKCVGLCGYELVRPHLCCVTGACDFKRLYEKKCEVLHVGRISGAIFALETTYVCTIKKDLGKWQRKLVKKWCSILEVITNRRFS